MELLLGALLVFVLRITDVSIGTLRVLFMVQGRRALAAALGVVESGVFIAAITTVFKQLDNPANMVGYALGFATGTYLGMTLEQWIAPGEMLVRVISRDQGAALRDALLADGFGLTAVNGEGREAEVMILFVVCPRRRGQDLLRAVKRLDADAFVTFEHVTRATGGYVPYPTAAARK